MAPGVPELIDVRPDERFDEARLASYLHDRLPAADRPLRVRQFAGGHANLTYLLRYGEGDELCEYVLRRPPLGPVAASSHDMHREYRALSRLWRSFPLAPRAYHYCSDAAVIGADFLIMERRHGRVVRGGVPPEFGGGEDAEANRRLSQLVVDTLADLHAVDPEKAGLADLGRDPENFLRRQVTGWTGRYERARTDDVPEAEEVSRWLLEHLPATPRTTLVHNDWRLDNMAVDPDDPGRCVAVYDWDMCTVGDPLCDLGTVLALWSEPGEDPAGTNPMPTQLPGFLTREEAAKRYAERSGCELAGIPYYSVFGTFKMAVVLQQIYFRYHRGQTQDERFASLDAAAKSLFRLAVERRPAS